MFMPKIACFARTPFFAVVAAQALLAGLIGGAACTCAGPRRVAGGMPGAGKIGVVKPGWGEQWMLPAGVNDAVRRRGR